MWKILRSPWVSCGKFRGQFEAPNVPWEVYCSQNPPPPVVWGESPALLLCLLITLPGVVRYGLHLHMHMHVGSLGVSVDGLCVCGPTRA